MNIHEYQAKQLLAKYGVAVPKGGVAYTADEAAKIAEDLGGPVWVVKSQIHAGGRGALVCSSLHTELYNLFALVLTPDRPWIYKAPRIKPNNNSH